MNSCSDGQQTDWLRNPLAVSARQYRLTIEGELSDPMAAAFAGMRLTRGGGTTVLDGSVRDQAELQGILQRVSSLGLTLLSASSIEEPDNP